MRENWQKLFLKGLEAETDVFRLGDLFKENTAQQMALERQLGRANPAAATGTVRQASEGEPAQVSEVVVYGRRPGWLHRQLGRVRDGLEDFANGLPADGQSYHGLPGVQPRTPQQQAEHAQFIRQRDAFHAKINSSDPLQRNIDAARRDPGKYAADVTIGTLRGVGQEGMNLANGGLAGYVLQHPELAASADAINRLTGKQVFEVGQGLWALPTVQVSQLEGLQPRGDIQNQWSYVGRFGGMVGTGLAAEAMLPARAIPSVYRPPRLPATPDGRYYSVAYEAKLEPIDWGRSEKVHSNRASVQLDSDLSSDPTWAAGMEEMIPGLRRSVSESGGRQKPANWMWHHDGVARPGVTTGTGEYGFLQLTPETQHKKGSPFWNTYHPDRHGRGGYSIWAVPAGAPRRR